MTLLYDHQVYDIAGILLVVYGIAALILTGNFGNWKRARPARPDGTSNRTSRRNA